MRVLMFAPCFAPYTASENLCNIKLALALLRCGCDVEVVSRRDDRGYVYASNWEEAWTCLQSHTHEIRYADGTPVGRALDLLKQAGSVPFPVTGLRWAGRALAQALDLHAAKPFDIILSRCPNEVAHLPALIMARRTGVPWIANWNDPPYHYWPPPYQRACGFPVDAYHHHLVRRVLSEASANTFPCRRLRDAVLRRSGRTSVRAHVLPHVAADVAPQSPRAPGEHLVLCHAGHLCAEQDPDPLFAALARMQAAQKEPLQLQVDFVGDEQPLVAAAAIRHGVQHMVTYSGGLSYGKALARMQAADLLLVLEAPYAEGLLLPSKVPDCAALGVPLLAVVPAIGTVSELIATYGGGLVADVHSVQQIVHALEQLYSIWQAGRLQTQFSTDRLAALFHPLAVAGQYCTLFEQLRTMDGFSA